MGAGRGLLVLYVRIHGHFASIQALEVVLLIGHFVVETFAFGRGQVIRHGLGPTCSSAANATASSPVWQALAKLFEARRRVEEVAKFGHHISGKYAKNVSLMLSEF